MLQERSLRKLGRTHQTSPRSAKSFFTKQTHFCGTRNRSITYLLLGFDDGREAVFLLGDGFRLAPTEGFVAEVEQLLSANAVQLR